MSSIKRRLGGIRIYIWSRSSNVGDAGYFNGRKYKEPSSFLRGLFSG
jgi:hypothetical protein